MSKTSSPLWFVIHASTEASEHGLVCGGGTDLPLSSAGMKEAAKTATLLAKRELPVRVIFCSPLLRSIQMADFIHDKLPCKLRVIQELGERKMGRWEGERIDRIAGYSPLGDRVPGGESLVDFRSRVFNILEWLKKQPQPALVVGHEFFARMLISLTVGTASGGPMEQVDRSFKPCEIIEISL